MAGYSKADYERDLLAIEYASQQFSCRIATLGVEKAAWRNIAQNIWRVGGEAMRPQVVMVMRIYDEVLAEESALSLRSPIIAQEIEAIKRKLKARLLIGRMSALAKHPDPRDKTRSQVGVIY